MSPFSWHATLAVTGLEVLGFGGGAGQSMLGLLFEEGLPLGYPLQVCGFAVRRSAPPGLID
jgi:hypothetical protein